MCVCMDHPPFENVSYMCPSHFDLRIYIYIYIYIYTHTHTHTYIHTYIHTEHNRSAKNCISMRQATSESCSSCHTCMYLYIYIYIYITWCVCRVSKAPPEFLARKARPGLLEQTEKENGASPGSPERQVSFFFGHHHCGWYMYVCVYEVCFVLLLVWTCMSL